MVKLRYERIIDLYCNTRDHTDNLAFLTSLEPIVVKMQKKLNKIHKCFYTELVNNCVRYNYTNLEQHVQLKKTYPVCKISKKKMKVYCIGSSEELQLLIPKHYEWFKKAQQEVFNELFDIEVPPCLTL